MGLIIRNPKGDELIVVWEVLCGAFGEKPRERFRRQIWEDSTFALDQVRIAEVDGKIVSHVWVAERPVFFRGKVVLPMGGIGGVGTLPEYRRQGLATLLLKDAIASMERKGYAISMLFTGINPFYARLGWADFPEWQFRLRVRRVPERDEIPDGYTVRPCDFDRDLPSLRALYRRHIEALRVSLPHARPDAFWRDGHPRYLGLDPSHVVVTGKGQVVAYACASGTNEGLRLSEFAYDPNYPLALNALAIALARNAKENGREGVIEGRTPWMHPLPLTLAALTDAPLWHQVSEAMMLRVLCLSSCLEAAVPLMESDLKAAKAEGLHGTFCFRLTQPEQAVVVEVRGGKVTLRESDEAPFTLTMTPRQFFLLFFGAVSAPDWLRLIPINPTHLSPDRIALLSLLFPSHPTVYFSGDHF